MSEPCHFPVWIERQTANGPERAVSLVVADTGTHLEELSVEFVHLCAQKPDALPVMVQASAGAKVFFGS